MKTLLQFGFCVLMANSAFAGKEGGAVIHGGRAGGTIGSRPGERGRPDIRNFRDGRYNAYGYGYGLGYYGDFFSPYADYGSAEPARAGASPSGPSVILVYPPAQPIIETAHPVIHEYGPSDFGAAPANSGPAAADDRPILYLLAFKDGAIHAAMTYWVEDDSVHYLDTNHKEKKAPLGTVDRDLSAQLNRERHVPFSIR